MKSQAPKGCFHCGETLFASVKMAQHHKGPKSRCLASKCKGIYQTASQNLEGQPNRLVGKGRKKKLIDPLDEEDSLKGSIYYILSKRKK